MGVRVLIADDDPLFLAALELALSTWADIGLVGAARDGAEAVTLYAENRPDVSIIDFAMPNGDGAEVTQRIRQLDRDAVVLILTADEDWRILARCLDAGASGFLRKGHRVIEYIPAAVAATRPE